MADNINNNSNNTDTDNNTSSVVKGDNNKVNITSIIEDNSGGLSSTRILMLLWGIVPLAVWAAGSVVALYHGIYVYPTLSPEVVTVMLGITGAKVVQRYGEK